MRLAVYEMAKLSNRYCNNALWITYLQRARKCHKLRESSAIGGMVMAVSRLTFSEENRIYEMPVHRAGLFVLEAKGKKLGIKWPNAETTMDELSRNRLQQVDRFIASLTPEQQALLKVGATRALRLTPYQQSLAAAIETPEGMTEAQSVEFTRQTTLEDNRERFQEGWARGQRDADKRANTLVWMSFAIGCCIAILILLARC
jgi:hypothetical protein